MRKTLFNKILLLLIFGLLLLGFFGCQKQPEQADTPKNPPDKSLRIGIIPEQDIFSQKKRYQPLADYIGDKLGINVELVMMPRYGNIIENFTVLKLDGAFFGSFTAAIALKALQVVPIARPECKDGTSTYYGMIFVRKDSGIHNAADMQGKRFVFVDPSTTAGYLLPLHYFREQGIDNYHTWFSETYFAGTHEDTIYDVLNKKADIGAAKNTVFYRFAKEDKRLTTELEILATSPPVPENGLSMKFDSNKNYLAAIRACLLEMDKDPSGKKVLENFGARRFIKTVEADYQPVFKFAHHIGLDLAKYQRSEDGPGN
jgi:phosphonate transport system substrate-binding protein